MILGCDYMGLTDYLGALKTHQVSFIEAKEVSDGYYQVLLESQNIDWKPGEHAIFIIDDQGIEGKNWRALSIASIKEENVIMLAMRSIGEMSAFKRTLINLKKGDQVKMRGPFGSFTLKDETTPIVLIALGIGITPIRALAKGEDPSRVESYIIGKIIPNDILNNRPKLLKYIDKKINLVLKTATETATIKMLGNH
jgi:NAD(P)H-flavin reductase